MMINVLCIGNYNVEGKFTKIQWRHFIAWCEIECNKLVVYSRMNYDIICTKFSKWCKISVIDKPDDTLDIYSYEIKITDNLFWTYIINFNYNIDIDNISHIYFFSGEKYIASLEVVDYENYILIEEFDNNQSKLLLSGELASENIQLCSEGKSDIDALTQETWKPLGE